jgi:hypothetical protein
MFFWIKFYSLPTSLSSFFSPPLLLVAGLETSILRFFAFSLIIEGTTEKVLEFKTPLKSFYIKNLGFVGQIMYF